MISKCKIRCNFPFTICKSGNLMLAEPTKINYLNKVNVKLYQNLKIRFM